MNGRGLIPALVVVVHMAVGCQTNTTMRDGRAAPPEPVQMPVMPNDARATQIATTVGIKPNDTNGNGFPDTISVQAYLMSSDHPGPIFEQGEFVFSIYPFGVPTREGAALAEWRIDAAVAEQKRFVSRFGPAYSFQLSLLDAGGDQYPLMSANLTCRFEPADGRSPVRTPEPIGIQIGRRVTARSAPLGH